MMLTAVFSSLVYMKRRSMMQIFPEKLRDIWKEWELRALVFISLISQLVLIIWGSRRRYNPNLWIAGLVWSAYLLADAVATMGLGVLLNNLGEIYEHHGCSIDANNELTAFWAPFFLLHLGGPDTITAYSIEDNELYLRHAFGLVFQTAATVYIILLAWNSGSDLSFLALLMTIVGCLKYGERTFTLFYASSDQLRDSMLTSPDAGPSYTKLMNEFKLKHSEGFHVEAQEILEASHQVEISVSAVPEPDSTAEERYIHKAYDLFEAFKRLFVDLILSFQDRDSSRSMFQKMSYAEAFKVTEIEVGFMYDLLYTKSTVIHTSWGLIRRIITTFLTFVVLVIFSCFVDRKKYTKIDLSVTFLLLIIAILLEIYAALFLLYSDLWLNQHNKVRKWINKIKNGTILKPTIVFLERMVKLKRWSNQMGQYSVTSLCLQEKHGFIGLINEISKQLRNIERLWEDCKYTTYKTVQEDLKKLVFEHVSNMKFDEANEGSTGYDKKIDQVKEVYSKWGSRILKIYKQESLNWSVAAEFDKSILLWHIATTLCYYANDLHKETNSGETKESDETNYRKFSKYLSRYMIYLLVVYPSLLPVGIGLIRFRDTCSETKKFVLERMPIYCSKDICVPKKDKRKCSFVRTRISHKFGKTCSKIRKFFKEGMFTHPTSQSQINNETSDQENDQRNTSLSRTGIRRGPFERFPPICLKIWKFFKERMFICSTSQTQSSNETSGQENTSLSPTGTERALLESFRDTFLKIWKFFKGRRFIYWKRKIQSRNETSGQKGDPRKERRIEACRMLLGVKTHVPPNKVKGDRSKSVLFDACKLAKELNKIQDEKKWEMIAHVWLEILTYAASQGRGSQHARRLKRGGEFLTHVWFLMAHFDMTDQFQISHGQAEAKLIVK